MSPNLDSDDVIATVSQTLPTITARDKRVLSQADVAIRRTTSISSELILTLQRYARLCIAFFLVRRYVTNWHNKRAESKKLLYNKLLHLIAAVTQLSTVCSRLITHKSIFHTSKFNQPTG